MSPEMIPLDLPAPVVPDAVLEQIAETYRAHGGRAVLGVPFETYVRRCQLARDPRHQARIALREAIDRRASGGR